jgi:hypothetical protein
MENPFERIEKPYKPVPQDLRGKVMKDVAFAKLLIGLANLFSLNLSSIVEKTMSNRDA